MSVGPWLPALAERLGPAAVCGAALSVPLIYVPNLRSVFAEPKLALLLVTGALGWGGQMVLRAHGLPRVRWPRRLSAAVSALLVTTVLAAAAAWLRGAPGAPYAGPELLRWLAVTGVALAAAQAAADPGWRWRLLAAIHASAGLVSFIGLLQHLQIGSLAIPIISVPGSTFGNRNIAGEAVALSIPFGLGLLALAAPARAATAAASSRPAAGEPPFGEAPARSPAAVSRPLLVLLFVGLALEFVYLGATRTRGAWLGAAVGAATFLALQRRVLPRPAVLAALALGAAALVAASVPGRAVPRDLLDAKRFAPGQRLVREALDPASPVLRTRLGLWRRTLAMYAEHPLLGVGPGNFAVLFPRYAEPGATADGVLSATVAPRRAHDDLLERLAETGPLGLAALLSIYAAAASLALRRERRAVDGARVEGARASHQQGSGAPAGVIGTAAAAATGSTVERTSAITAAAGAGGLAALLVCGLTGFPLAMPATALLFGIALGLLACDGPAGGAHGPSGDEGAARSVPPPPPPPTVAGVGRGAAGAWLLAALMVSAAAVAGARSLRRSYWQARAESALRERDAHAGAERAVDFLRRAEWVDPGRFEVALDRAFVADRLGLYAEAAQSAERALATEPYSPNAWSARAEAFLGQGDARAAAATAGRALALLDDYPDAWLTMARADRRLGDGRGERTARERLERLAPTSERARGLLAGLPPAPPATLAPPSLPAAPSPPALPAVAPARAFPPVSRPAPRPGARRRAAPRREPR